MSPEERSEARVDAIYAGRKKINKMAYLYTEEGDLENNAELQKEELEALSAIYGEDFLLENYNDEDSIYFEGVTTVAKQNTPVMPTFSITIRQNRTADSEVGMTNDSFSEVSKHSEARLIVTFQPGYPTSSPPIYQLSIPWLRGGQKQVFANTLEELYLEHLGESIVYIWVEKVRDLLRVEVELSTKESHNIPCGAKNVSEQNANKTDLCTGAGYGYEDATYAAAAVDPLASKELIDQFSNSLSFNLAISAAGDGYVKDGSENTSFGNLYEGASPVRCAQKSEHPEKSFGQVPPIRTSAPLTDRKSTFQAHVAPVNDTSEIRLVLDELYQNKKIASATHNMYAYRILKTESKTWFQDCDDDGETHAGSRLLHLLQILDCRNVIVVVSRWYGGIQLHGDRFKHINNVARQSLFEFGFIPGTDSKKMDDQKSKKGSVKR